MPAPFLIAIRGNATLPGIEEEPMAWQPERPEFVRLFTLEEATALLSSLRPRLQALAAMKRQLDEMQRDFAELQRHVPANGHAKRARELERELRALIDTINREVAAIHALGIEVKDLTIGLVDFPSEREDRVVYLCWRMDEPAIVAWHELDAGYRGRQSL
jgi:hypothetical protein